MVPFERRNQIIKYVEKHKYVDIKTLSKQLYVSEATLRRNVRELAKEGLVRRYHGGVAVVEIKGNESHFELRLNTNRKEKEYMASLVTNMLEENQSIYLDNSTTVYYLSKYLNSVNDLRVFSNGLDIAISLSENTKNDVVVPPGSILRVCNSIVGSSALSFISDLTFDIGFFSCSGMSEKGCFETLLENREIKKMALTRCKTKVLLVDKSKIGNEMMFKTCDLSVFDLIVFSEKPDATLSKYLEDNNIDYQY